MLIYFLRHGLTEYNAEKRYQGQRQKAGCPAFCRWPCDAAQGRH